MKFFMIQDSRTLCSQYIWEPSQSQVQSAKDHYHPLQTTMTITSTVYYRQLQYQQTSTASLLDIVFGRAMNRRNNPRHQVRLANTAPEHCPNHHKPQAGRSPCHDRGHLWHSLADEHRVIADWIQWHKSVKPILASAQTEKLSLSYTTAEWQWTGWREI